MAQKWQTTRHPLKPTPNVYTKLLGTRDQTVWIKSSATPLALLHTQLPNKYTNTQAHVRVGKILLIMTEKSTAKENRIHTKASSAAHIAIHAEAKSFFFYRSMNGTVVCNKYANDASFASFLSFRRCPETSAYKVHTYIDMGFAAVTAKGMGLTAIMLAGTPILPSSPCQSTPYMSNTAMLMAYWEAFAWIGHCYVGRPTIVCIWLQQPLNKDWVGDDVSPLL